MRWSSARHWEPGPRVPSSAQLTATGDFSLVALRRRCGPYVAREPALLERAVPAWLGARWANCARGGWIIRHQKRTKPPMAGFQPSPRLIANRNSAARTYPYDIVGRPREVGYFNAFVEM